MSSRSRHVERFMPYASAREGLEFTHVRCSLEGSVHHEIFPGAVLPAAIAQRRELTLSVGLALHGDVLPKVLPSGELREPPIAIVLAVRCPATYLSLSHCIAHSDPSIPNYEQFLTLQRDELHGEVSITPYLVRTRTGARHPGYAWRKGAWLATGHPWTLYVDEPKPQLGNNLEILQKRFSEVPEIPVEHHKNWFFLQLERATPRLFLNTEHSLLITALHDQSARGKRASVRDVLFDLLDATVWPALVMHAAHEVENAGEASYPWQENVLRRWARLLYPEEHDLAAGVQCLVEQVKGQPIALLLEINGVLQRDKQVRRLERVIGEVYS